MMEKIFTTTDGKQIARVSRWISIKTDWNITPRHPLYYYSCDADDGKRCVDYFVFHGRKYALDQFYRFGTMFTPTQPPMWYENSKLQHMAGYDSENYFCPLMIEVDEYGEHIRVYAEVTNP